MTGTEQLSQVSFPTEIGWSIKFFVGIANPFRTNTEYQKDPTIQQTTVQSNQGTVHGHSYQYYLHLGSLDSGTDVTSYVQNIDNRTGMKPQGNIVTTIPESKRMNNCKIFDSISRTSDLAYRGSLWHVTKK